MADTHQVRIAGDFLRRVVHPYSGAAGARQARIIAAIAGGYEATLAGFGIATALRIAHFTAQIGHESDRLSTTEEYADGRAYEGRTDLGNTQPGDGPRFKGRGLLQLTGRAYYLRFGDALGIDLVADPARAGDPVISLRIACLFWQLHALNALCDKDDLPSITRRVNGGLNGLDDRRILLGHAKAALLPVPVPVPA